MTRRILAVLLGAALALTVLAPTANAAGVASERGGWFVGNGQVDRFQQLERWLGRDAHAVMQFAGRSSPREMVASTWGQVVHPGRFQTRAGDLDYVLTVPLAFGWANARSESGKREVAANLRATAAGAHDGDYRVVARMLTAAGFGDAVIRLGHEFDIPAYPWSAWDNCGAYVTAFRHVVEVFRSVSSGFRFDWTGSVLFSAMAQCAYPGDAYVDIVGLDFYDRGAAKELFSPSQRTWSDPEAAWNRAILPRLQAHAAFARSRGKQVSYPEWALSGGGTQSADSYGGDNPTFIRKVHEWMNGLGGTLAYHTYFTGNPPHSGPHSLDHFPRAQAEFKRLFGCAGRGDAGPHPSPWGRVRPRRGRRAVPLKTSVAPSDPGGTPNGNARRPGLDERANLS